MRQNPGNKGGESLPQHRKDKPMKIIVKIYNSNIELFGEDNNLSIDYNEDVNYTYTNKDVYDDEDEAIASAEGDYREAMINAFPEHSSEEIEDALLTVMITVSARIHDIW